MSNLTLGLIRAASLAACGRLVAAGSGATDSCRRAHGAGTAGVRPLCLERVAARGAPVWGRPATGLAPEVAVGHGVRVPQRAQVVPRRAGSGWCRTAQEDSCERCRRRCGCDSWQPEMAAARGRRVADRPFDSRTGGVGNAGRATGQGDVPSGRRVDGGSGQSRSEAHGRSAARVPECEGQAPFSCGSPNAAATHGWSGWIGKASPLAAAADAVGWLAGRGAPCAQAAHTGTDGVTYLVQISRAVAECSVCVRYRPVARNIPSSLNAQSLAYGARSPVACRMLSAVSGWLARESSRRPA